MVYTPREYHCLKRKEILAFYRVDDPGGHSAKLNKAVTKKIL